jgi:DNA-binding transcriptional LysR family regulator
MYLHIDDLRPFVVLAEELHFGRAAARLFVSQPSLSKQIRRLEERVGAAMFARTRRNVVLTEAGRVLLPAATRLLRESATAFALAREAARGCAGVLRIGFGLASLAELLPRTILRFRRVFPHIELQMRDMSTPAQIAALLDGGIDIGIVRLPVARPELKCASLLRERLVVATPRTLPYRSKLGLAGLRDRPFVIVARSVSETNHDHVLAVCRKAGFTPNIVQETSETFTTLNLVRAGLGVTLVPSSSVRMRVPGVRLHELGMPEAEWSIGAAWHRQSTRKELVTRFTDTLGDVAAGLGGQSRLTGSPIPQAGQSPNRTLTQIGT